MTRKKTTKRKTKTSSDDAPDRDKLEELAATGSVASESDSSETPAGSETVESDSPRKKRGRKPKEEPPDIPPPLLLAVVKAPYAIAAKFYGPHWNLSDEEAENMVGPHVELAKEWVPDAIRERPALYSCILLHAMALLLRLGISKAMESQETEPKPVGWKASEAVERERSTTLPREARFGEIIPDAKGPPGVSPGSGL